MYLQITTKCNMLCAHCCYNCTMRGKHGDFSTIIDAISFARNYDDSVITIGGGEPTLHPKFFDILKICLDDFDYVWMATNGSQTKTMYRVANIINNCDHESFEVKDYDTCDPEDRDDCYCEPKDLIYQEEKLSVALSQDYFHDEIDERIVNIWKRNKWEIRDVTKSTTGPSKEGRAKKTGSGWSDHCVCSDIIIKPNGTLKLCGCNSSPTIGDVWNGIMPKYEEIIKSDSFQETLCHKSIKRRLS